MRRLSPMAMICAVLLGGPAVAQEAEAPAAPALELRRQSPPYTLHLRHLSENHTLRFRDGEVRVREGAVHEGDVLVSVPVQHRRTFVLTEPLAGGPMFGRVSLPAGAQGYQAINVPAVVTSGGGGFTNYRGEQGTMWCFFTNDPGERLRSRCIFSGYVAECDDQPLVPVGCLVGVTLTPIPEPRVEDRPLSFVEDLRVEHVFRGLSRTRATLEIKLNGQRVMMQYGDWDAQGVADFYTVVGHVRVQRDGNRRAGALVSVVPFTEAELAEFDTQPLSTVTWIR